MVSRRQTRVRFRLARQRQSLRRQGFPRIYLTRRANATRILEESSEIPNIAKEADQQSEDVTKLHSIALFAFGMPILAKVGLLVTLAAIFLRMGSVTFGGGLVMIPLIESEVVNTHHWLSHQEFADATALGQITPGPVLITATFIGYRVAGTIGALVATVSIFLPAFLMTIAAGSSLRRFRSNTQVQSFLRGIAPAVVGLLVAAALSIGRAGIHSWIGISIMVIAIFTLVRFRPNAFWVIIGAGFVRFLIGLIVS
jgi:chromate transporter